MVAATVGVLVVCMVVVAIVVLAYFLHTAMSSRLPLVGSAGMGCEGQTVSPRAKVHASPLQRHPAVHNSSLQLESTGIGLRRLGTILPNTFICSNPTFVQVSVAV